MVNPFIYSFLSTQFRQKLAQVLERKIRRRKYKLKFFTRSHDLKISYLVYIIYLRYKQCLYFVKDIFQIEKSFKTKIIRTKSANIQRCTTRYTFHISVSFDSKFIITYDFHVTDLTIYVVNDFAR